MEVLPIKSLLFRLIQLKELRQAAPTETEQHTLTAKIQEVEFLIESVK